MTDPVVVTSTTQLIPAGLAGYAKTIVAVASGVLIAVVPFLPVDGNWQRYAQIALAVLGALGVYLVPNAVKPVTIAPPPVNIDLEATERIEETRTVDTTVLGVVPPPVVTIPLPEDDPPGRHEKTLIDGSIPAHDDTGNTPGAPPPMPGSYPPRAP